MELYAIRHKPSGAYMPTKMFRSSAGGWSHWIPGVPPDGCQGCDGFDKNARLFFTKRAAQNALTAWLMGVHRRDQGVSASWGFCPDEYDKLVIDTPPVERKREDMEIVPLQLTGLA